MVAGQASGPRHESRPMNPFRARCLRPGALDYVFPSGQSYAVLVDRLLAEPGAAQIVGPHGSGKSTLLLGLIPELQRRGCQPRLARLLAGQRRLPWRWHRIAQFPTETIILLDGWEQLTWLGRQAVRCHARLFRQVRWLVTSHADAGMRTIYETRVTTPLARQVIDRLLAPMRDTSPSPPPIPTSLVSCLLRQHEGNLREALFSFYDWYEQSLRQPPTEHPT